MKKFFACAAALSFALVACGDDSSSNAKGGEKGATLDGKEIAHTGDCGVFTPSEGEGEAFVIGSKDGGYQVLLPKMDYNVAVCYKCLYERSGDTLHIWDSDTTRESLNWFCTTDIWFDISDADTDVKYFKYEDTVFQIVEGPAPGKISSGMVVTSSSSENPSSSGSVESSSSQGTSSAVQPGSSSDVPPGESSSSVTPQGESSSSVTPPSSSSKKTYNGHVPLKSITATCQDGDLTYDPVEPSQPKAYLGISNSFAEIELFNVKLTYACDSASQLAFWDSLKADNTVASVIGDTLFVNFERFDEKGVEYKCGCTAKVEFTFDEQYAGFGYTAFENNRPPVELGYKLINRPDPTYQKVEEADAQCVKDGPDDPMVDAALPPVALMYVNGDSAQIVVERVMVTCGTEFESVEIRMEDSTLYVTPHYDPSSMFADCLCSSKVSFNVKMVDVYKEATTLVFDDGTSINLGNKMRLIVE